LQLLFLGFMLLSLSSTRAHIVSLWIFRQFISYFTEVHYFEPFGSYPVAITCFKTLH